MDPAPFHSASEEYDNAISTYQSFNGSNSCPVLTTVATVAFLCLKGNAFTPLNFREISALCLAKCANRQPDVVDSTIRQQIGDRRDEAGVLPRRHFGEV